MPTLLLLDDDPQRHAHYAEQYRRWTITHAYSYDECVRALDAATTPFDVAQLDHDLDWMQAAGLPSPVPSGTNVAEYIAKLPPNRVPKTIVIHSWNRQGRARMAHLLRATRAEVTIKPSPV